MKPEAWVLCQSTTMTVFRPGGGDYPREATGITLNKKYRVEEPTNPSNDRLTTILDDTGGRHTFPEYLFIECDPPAPDERPAGLPLSTKFVSDVHVWWGRHEQVIDAALNETFLLGDAWGGFDHDDQVRDAKRVALLVGLMASGTPDAFIEAFRHINDNKD